MNKALAFALVAGCSGLLFADGNSASATAQASVRIYAPITLVKSTDLDFGQIILDNYSDAASIVLDENTYPGMLKSPVKCSIKNNSTPAQVACFHYLKDASLAVNVQVDPTVTLQDGVTITTAKGGDLTCTWFYPNPTGTDSFHFYVGGKLDIPAGVVGQKTGMLNVTVSYN